MNIPDVGLWLPVSSGGAIPADIVLCDSSNLVPTYAVRVLIAGSLVPAMLDSSGSIVFFTYDTGSQDTSQDYQALLNPVDEMFSWITFTHGDSLPDGVVTGKYMHSYWRNVSSVDSSTHKTFMKNIFVV